MKYLKPSGRFLPTRLSSLVMVLIGLIIVGSTAHADQPAQTLTELEKAEKLILKLGYNGPEPKQVKLSKLDSSVFFLNTTSDALVTLSIPFGKHKAHCASDNLKWNAEEGSFSSSTPIAPKDFAVTCFPDSGTYDVAIYGLKKDGSVSKAQVIVP